MRATSSKMTALFRLRLPGQRARRAVCARPHLEDLEPRALLSVIDNGGDFPRPVYSGFADQVISDAANRTLGESTYKNPPSPIGRAPTPSPGDTNFNTDSPNDGVGPHNETTIAVNPTNPDNIIVSANDYQLRLSSGGRIFETAYSRAHVTFDRGKTWTEYPIPYNGYTATGDPSVAFDAAGNAYLATLGFVWSQSGSVATNPDILVAHSSDGGKTWSAPSRVASGTGIQNGPGTFNDKEYIAAWGNGNAIVTWTVFNLGDGGSYSLDYGSPIYASVTHDGGQTWTRGALISGNPGKPITGNAIGLYDQGSVPVVAADGSIYVAFLNTPPENVPTNASGRDQYMVVKVDSTTGKPLSTPQVVAPIYDGYTDNPINTQGRQTYQDSQFRTWAIGNIAADPTNAGHLAVVWSDMRNSTLPAPIDPYSAKTNSDVVVSQSFDGGKTWSGPVALGLNNDQFMPWGAYDNTGLLQIGFFDRSYDQDNHLYGYTLASEVKSGSLTFTYNQVTTKLSDPTKGDRWFSGSTPNSAFPHPTTFLGDYSGIAAPSSGGVFATWTDMRNSVNFTTREGWGEDAYFAVAIPPKTGKKDK